LLFKSLATTIELWPPTCIYVGMYVCMCVCMYVLFIFYYFYNMLHYIM